MQIIATLLLLASAVTAVPAPIVPAGTPTEGLAKRSYASGSLTCYFQCPPAAYGYAVSSEYGTASGEIFNCYYPITGVSGAFHSCPFYLATGMVYNSGYAQYCGAQAAGPFCGLTAPNDGNKYFKRDSATLFKREKSDAELAIQARQYVPPRREA